MTRSEARRQNGQSAPLFLAVLALAAAFVWGTSADLPAVVASHFDAAGHPNGYMPREVYRGVMLALIVFAPGAVVLMPLRKFGDPEAKLNLPHRDYWLAPERRPATTAYLQAHALRFGVLLTLFLAYGHWLVVQANAVHPPALPSHGFVIALIVFLAATAAWIATLMRHFSRVPQ